MKNKINSLLRLISLAIILLLGIFAPSVILTGCGTSDAAAKKEKSKKAKKKAAEQEDSEEESGDESEKKNGEKSGESKKEHKESPKLSDADFEKVWTDLMNGNEKFVKGVHNQGDLVSARKALSKGQKPDAIILGCADSRVPPELVFNKNLGELFVVRAAGNIADPISLGSIEYAVEHLHSTILIILGHESCGAVAATVSGEEMPTKNLTAIINKIGPALEGSESCPIKGKMNNSCIELNVKQSATDVLMNSPILKKAVEGGHLKIIQAVYQLETGKVVRLEK